MEDILSVFRALPLHRRYDAMRMACTYALDVWDRYTKGGAPIVYVDGVVGMEHQVDMRLPFRAIEAVDRKLAGDKVDPKPIWNSYSEPIAALQDGDLDLPDGIAMAYYAIYNLYGFVFGMTKLYDDGDIVIRQAATGDGFLEDWWTRTWDAWATRQPPKYAPTELDEKTFAALCAGDLTGALATCQHETRLHAVLLAIAGRTDEAVAVAARILRVSPPEDAEWLRDAALFCGPSDAIAVSSDGKLYAVICGSRYHVREIAGNHMRLDGRCGWDLRRVSFTKTNQIVCWAGDASDDIGPYQTIITGEELYSADYGYRVELLGARTILALGSGAEIVCASEHDAGIVTSDGFDRFGSDRVVGAVLHPRYLVTYAGPAFTVWSRETRMRVVAMELGAEIWHAMIAGGRLVLACRDAPARILDVSLFG